MSERVTASFAQAIGVLSEGGTRVTETFAQAMALDHLTAPRQHLTQAFTQVIRSQTINNGLANAGSNRLTMAYVNVLIPSTPDFTWLDMIIDEVFPFDISYNSIGATRFQTDVIRVDSGHDQRASRWDQPLMEYDVAYGVRTLEQLHALIAFFRVMMGRKYAFLYQDIVDHTSTLATEMEARSAPDISFLDQQLGVTDGSATTYQLTKTYPTPSGMSAKVRPIYRPEPGTVIVGLGGQQVTNFTVDNTQGKIAFVSTWGKSALQGMSIQQVQLSQVADAWMITGAAGTFTGLAAGDRIVTNGWANAGNNSTEATLITVAAIATDGSTLTLSVPANFGQAENNRNGVTVYRHPAPKAGAVVTAGFKFYVPVRFDTDRLPVSLDYYGIGGAADVKLVEVRPASEAQVS